MKKILPLMIVGLASLTLLSCQSKNITDNKTRISLDIGSYQDYIDVDIQLNKIDDYAYYRWVVTPCIPYEDYLFENGTIVTKGNFPYENYIETGVLVINLNRYGYAKSKWIQLGRTSYISSNLYEYLDQTLEISDVDGYIYY